MKRNLLAVLLCAPLTAGASCDDGAAGASIRPLGGPLRVGSKQFTESVVLGEIVAQLGRHAGAQVEHRRELGGTQILFNALLIGDIDAYPEYTGTITEELFAGRKLRTEDAIREALFEQGVHMIGPLGFSNNYVLGMKKQRAADLSISKISDLLDHPELTFGFSSEFMDRGDGWPSLRVHYGLPQGNVRGLDHDISYRGLESDSIDVIDLYSTDAEIEYYDLALLEDDLGHFAVYKAVLLYRSHLTQRTPRVVQEWQRLNGLISEAQMIALNKRAKIDKTPEARVAADFLADVLDIHAEVRPLSRYAAIWKTTKEHLNLVAKSMLAAVLVAIPLGIWAAKRPGMAHGILGIVGIIQTIPALALLVLLMTMLKPLKPFGIDSLGEPPAIVALFLYSLLPIVRNTYTGLHDIPIHIRESAAALGLPPGARLRLVELPMVSRMILAGIKTAAVINVGFATLGALIGAGGYGQPILTGIRLDDTGLILQGAVPAALLAVLMQGLFELAERIVVPRGLRLRAET